MTTKTLTQTSISLALRNRFTVIAVEAPAMDLATQQDIAKNAMQQHFSESSVICETPLRESAAEGVTNCYQNPA